ncbi:MAG: cell wall-binding repeat-containing protein, partial [Raoultibacter sp.]
FGTPVATLQANGSPVLVGASSAASGGAQYLPSLYIAPAVDATAELYADGIATANATAKDSRSVVRNADKPDAGAVDIGWIKLNPNGGIWEQATIGDYNTTRMLSYTDDTNVPFVFMAADTGSTIALPGTAMFSATPSDSALLGWGETVTSRPGDADFHAVGSSVLASEGAVAEQYYAIWEDTAKIDVELSVARLYGADRYGTSRQVSTYEREAANEDTVILASGWDYNFPDALTASVLSGYLNNAPIVLTENDHLSADARAAIVDDLGVSRVVIVGSTDAINADVEAEVVALAGVTTVERIGGVDRQETAEKIFEYIGADHSDTAIIARCCDFPDSLTISPWSVATKSPIFLSDFDLNELTDETKAALAAGGFTRILVLGDENSTPASVYEEAKNAAGLTDEQMVRLGGIDRYETSSIIAEWITSEDRTASERLNWSKPALARGDIHPDSLTGGALQGRDRSVILLTEPTEASSFARPLVEAKNGTITEIRFFGDENA